MNERRLRGALRATAIAIAVAALVDPVWSVERAPAMPLTLIRMTTADVAPVERELNRITPDAGVQVREVLNHRVPCGPGDRCVVIADGSVDAELPSDLDGPLSLIRVGDPAGPNVRVRSVTFAAGQQASAAGVARVVLEGRGVIGRRTELRVSDSAAIVGSASVEWRSDGVQAVDVPWWPLASGPRALRVEAIPTDAESALFDNALTAGVDVGSDRLPVLVFDARSSWGSTFVRRALEDDSRFLVEHRARLAPAIAAGTANGHLDVRALDASAVLIVGGPDALTANDVDLIERYVRVRGGTVIMLPERAPSGSVARLFAGEWTERLAAEPQSVGPLKASELLVYPAKAGHHSVLAQAGELPVIVAIPTGAGRIVVSGAMDAWRYRDDDGPSTALRASAFDRFWRSVVTEGAAAGAAVRLEFDNAVGAAGSRQPLTLRYRSMHPPSTIEATAVARCGSPPRAQVLRLWPAGSPAVLRGELPIADGDACTVEAAINGATVTRGIAVSSAPSRSADDTLATVERVARASGGVVTDKDNLDVRLHASDAPARQPFLEPVRPMRSAWWLLPFAGCLSVEWWLRRRMGLR